MTTKNTKKEKIIRLERHTHGDRQKTKTDTETNTERTHQTAYRLQHLLLPESV